VASISVSSRIGVANHCAAPLGAGCQGLIIDLVWWETFQGPRHVFNGRLLIFIGNRLVAWPQMVSRTTFSIPALAALCLKVWRHA
jgi:hypothetical protein